MLYERYSKMRYERMLQIVPRGTNARELDKAGMHALTFDDCKRYPDVMAQLQRDYASWFMVHPINTRDGSSEVS